MIRVDDALKIVLEAVSPLLAEELRLLESLNRVLAIDISAEIDIIDYCGPGCTKAFLYEGNTTVATAANTVVSTQETLTLAAGTATVDRLAVSSCEGIVTEIRIEYNADASEAESGTWGTIKSLYK